MLDEVVGSPRGLAPRLRALFTGSPNHHVTFKPNAAPEANGKLGGRYATRPGPPSIEDVENHVRGRALLGVIPILPDGTVWWGCVDDDTRPGDPERWRERIEAAKLPLVVARSKSGSIHLYLFLKRPAPAAAVRELLATWAAGLGLPAFVEIFPKQTALGADEAGSCALLPVGDEAELLRFVDAAEAAELDDLPAAVRGRGRTGDGSAAASGKAREGRNGYLFSLACALFARDLDADAVRAAVEAENAAADVAKCANFADGPLPTDEVVELLRSALKLHVRKDGVPPWCEELNREYAFVQQGGDVFLLREHPDPVDGEPLVDYCGVGTLNQVLANRPPVPVGKHRDGTPTYQPLATAWLRSPHRRQYLQGVVFEPGRELNGVVYNLWRGWPMAPGRADECPLFRRHLDEVICPGEPAAREYLWKWLAHLVQRPNELPEVSIVLRGPNGAGKGAFVQYLARLVTPHFTHLQDSTRLTAQFNSAVLGRLLIYADEAFFAGDRRHAGQLKGLISEERQWLEKKFREPVKIRNYGRLIVGSNEEWVVPADLDARRFLVLDVSEAHVGDREYFNRLLEERRGEGPAALLAALSAEDLTGYDVRSVPKTKALANQKIRTMDAELSFVADLLLTGTLPGRESEPGVVPFLLLFAAFEEHARRRGAFRAISATAFALRLKDCRRRSGLLSPKTVLKMEKHLVPTNRYEQMRDTGEVKATFEVKRGTVWQLPSLVECRRRFESAAGQEFDWSTGADEWITHEELGQEDAF